MLKASNINKPAPRWFRLTKKILSLTINTVISLLLIMGYTSESVTLLVIKLAESYLMNLLDTLLSNGEVYATYTAPGDEEQQNNKS